MGKEGDFRTKTKQKNKEKMKQKRGDYNQLVLAVWLRPWLGLCQNKEKPMRETLSGRLTVVYMVERCRFGVERWRAMEALKQRVSKGLDREWLRVFEELRDFILFYFILYIGSCSNVYRDTERKCLEVASSTNQNLYQ